MNYYDLAVSILKELEEVGSIELAPGIVLMTQGIISEKYKGVNFTRSPYWINAEHKPIPIWGSDDLVDILKDVF